MNYVYILQTPRAFRRCIART